MINDAGKLLFSAFVAILVGLVLIQPVADDISTARLGSRTVANESVSLSVTTGDVSNESQAVGISINLSQNHLTIFTELRNDTADVVLGLCNVTLDTGNLICNVTTSTNLYAEYTYNAYSTGALANDELITFDACRNSTATIITAGVYCNVTTTTGAVKVEFDNFSDNSAFIDYTYTPDGYVRSASSRTILNLTTLFFAIAVLTVGIMFAWKSLKDKGII